MLLGDRMTFLKKANQKYLFYGFIALFLIGCANPVWWYRSPTSDYTHFDFDPTELNCIELTEEVIRVSAIISDIAAKLTEQADRDTGYASFGFETNNPRTGQNFFGFRSTAVDPKVVEYKETLEVLEEMQVLLIDNCSPDKVDP